MLQRGRLIAIAPLPMHGSAVDPRVVARRMRTERACHGGVHTHTSTLSQLVHRAPTPRLVCVPEVAHHCRRGERARLPPRAVRVCCWGRSHSHIPREMLGVALSERTVDKDGALRQGNLVPDPQARAQGLPDEGSGRLAPPRNRSKAKADEISFSWDFVSVVHIHLHGRVENASSPKKPEEFSSYAATRALPRGGAAARAAAHEAAPRLCATRPLARSPAGAQSALRRKTSSWS